MIPKTILCPVLPEVDIKDIRPVVELCQRHEAHLTVPMIETAPPVPISIEAPMSSDWADRMLVTRARTAKCATALENALRENGIAADVQPIVGRLDEISHLTGQYGRFADLAVASPIMMTANDVWKRTVFGLLFESGRPVLIEPEEWHRQLTLTPGTVLVAWDGAIAASRAVGLAIGIMKSAQAVHIVCVDPTASDLADGPAPGWDLAGFLTRHGIEVIVKDMPSGGLSVDGVLRRHAIEIGADLLVMGAYGHSRLRERLFGGTTRTMLAKTTVPLFMAH